MQLFIKDNLEDTSILCANFIKDRINNYNKSKFILGLPTGGTPLKVYKQLIKHYKNNEISFKNIITFNMDEYVGLSSDHPQSYSYYMHNNFFQHIDIPHEQINLLDGLTTDKQQHCLNYEEKIKSLGGIELFLGGIGYNGHIAFNEPFSSLSSITREKTLTKETLRDNSRFFSKDEKQPKTALTVGIQTIFNAKQIVIMASGENKANAVKQTVEGVISHAYPSTALQRHQDFILICDKAAACQLSEKTINYFKQMPNLT